MTFRVERVTPGRVTNAGGHDIYHRLRLALPFDVDIDLPEPRTDFESTCRCIQVYRLTDESVEWLKKRELYAHSGRPFKNAVVCRCMGVLTT